MKRSGPILISAPGAGLGHLVRAGALGLALKKLRLPVRIVTNSPYAPGLARLVGLNIDHVPTTAWPTGLAGYIMTLQPTMLVVDSFPAGWRGEWAAVPANVRTVLLARRLDWDNYFTAVGPAASQALGFHRQVIVIEPLEPDYADLLTGSTAQISFLSSRIRFPAELFPVPIPPALDELLDQHEVHLVVHSGPSHEVAQLVALANQDATLTGGIVTIISPVTTTADHVPSFEYFPAARLYDQAARVYTGAGYNALAESAGRVPGRVVHVPFPRRYDQQADRLYESWVGTGNGTGLAAELIASWSI